SNRFSKVDGGDAIMGVSLHTHKLPVTERVVSYFPAQSQELRVVPLKIGIRCMMGGRKLFLRGGHSPKTLGPLTRWRWSGTKGGPTHTSVDLVARVAALQLLFRNFC